MVFSLLAILSPDKCSGFGLLWNAAFYASVDATIAKFIAEVWGVCFGEGIKVYSWRSCLYLFPQANM